jgi:AraC-like DNA-binding protein
MTMAEQIAQPLRGTQAERLRGALPDSMPVVLRSAVHNHVCAGRFRQPWSKRLVLIKWVISGEAAFRVRGRRMSFGPGQVAVYMPSVPHQMWAVAPVSEMCWFSTDGALCEQFAHMLGLRPGVYSYGDPPVEAIDELIGSLRDQSRPGRLRSSELAICLQYQVVKRLPPQPLSTLGQQVRHLVQEGLGDPNLSAKEIAAKLSYNRSSLSRTFHRDTGMTIMDCITQTRLQEAALLLQQTDDRIGDIAKKCGFRDAGYFALWVKKHVGKTPHELRETTDWPKS